MSLPETKELYYWDVPVGTPVYNQQNELLGYKTSYSSRPTATSSGHIEINHSNGTSWINGLAIYVIGMGLILV